MTSTPARAVPTETPESEVRRLLAAVADLPDATERERAGLALEAMLVDAAAEARSIAREAQGPLGRETTAGIAAAEDHAQGRAPWA